MSNARYLEIDSRFRDRNLWPHPSEFEIPISQSGRKGSVNAVDPVSDAAVLTSWTSNRFNSLGGDTLTVTIESTSIGFSGTDSVLIVKADPGHMQVMSDYYNGSVISSTVGPPNVNKRRIIGYTFLGTDGTNDRARFTLAQPFTSGIALPGQIFDIKDPTNIPAGPPGLGSAPIYFIPGPQLGENILVQRILYNETQDESRPLLVYDRETSTVQVDITGSSTHDKLQGPVIVPPNSWTLKDTYSLRTTTPILQTQLNGEPLNNPSTKTSFNFLPTVSFPTDSLVGSFLELLPLPPSPGVTLGASATNNVITLVGNSPGVAAALQDFYVGYDVRITGPALAPSLGEIRRIIAYDIATNLATVDRDFSALLAAATEYSLFFPTGANIFNLHQARRITKWVNFSGVTSIASASNLVMEFPSDASDITGYYNDLYITTTLLGVPNRRMIKSYDVIRNSLGDVVSRTATVYNAFSALPPASHTFSITSGITLPFTFSISQQTTPAPLVTQTFTLLPFTVDNLVPFVYTGSMVSQQEMVCYEIELINLILPNITLGTAYGSLISFYQYVYVELQNVSSSGAGNQNIIYSNNPNSTKMLFRCPIKDVPNPTNSTFIKIDGNGMKQTIKFKPNDNIRFSVHMSTGELFKTLVPEIFGPNSPDPITQISACFSMKRL